MLGRPAVKSLYTIAGRRILIEAEDEWSARTASNLFSGWFLKPLTAKDRAYPDATLRFKFRTPPPTIPDGLFAFNIPEGGVCHTDGQTFFINFNGSLVVSGPRETRNVDIWATQGYEPGSRVLAQLISQALCAALRRCDLYELHSAGVVPPGFDKALLIAGSSGSGKTTLALQLAALGWNYLSDDKLLLHSDQEGLEVYALRKCFALRAHTISALELSHLMPAPAIPGIKERISPEDLFSATQIDHARPGGIVLPVLTHKSSSDLRRLTAAEVMTKLLRLCPWAGYDKPTAAKHLELLADLARECGAFELLAGTDLLEDRGLAAELCLRCLQSND